MEKWPVIRTRILDAWFGGLVVASIVERVINWSHKGELFALAAIFAILLADRLRRRNDG
jgi:uncharacterized membrane protein